MRTRGASQSHSVLKRAPRPPLTRARLYRAVVPLFLIVLATTTVGLVIFAIGLLLGLVPLPGR